MQPDTAERLAEAAQAWLDYLDKPDWVGSHADEMRLLGNMRKALALYRASKEGK